MKFLIFNDHVAIDFPGRGDDSISFGANSFRLRSTIDGIYKGRRCEKTKDIRKFRQVLNCRLIEREINQLTKPLKQKLNEERSKIYED